MKNLNWNEHPKKPDQPAIDNLMIPYFEQVNETKAKMKGFSYNPANDGKPDFKNKLKIEQQTFSSQDYFKTVFISGDDMVKELKEQKQKEIDDFNKKVVVDNTHLRINTLEKRKVAQLDKYKNIREDEAKKIGLKNKKRNISRLIER